MHCFAAEKHSILWADHILFIHKPLDGHLGCFYFGATVNNAMENICVCFNVDMFCVPLGVHLGVELLGHMPTLINRLRNYHTI